MLKVLFQKGFAAFVCAAMLLACKRDMITKNNLVVDCRIKQLIMKSEGAKDQSGSFTYNADGNPVSYTPKGYSNGSLKYEFRYDNNGRLTDYIGYYPTSIPLTYEFWVKYNYDNGRIVRDSSYYNCNYGPTIISAARYKGVTQYEYDKQSRISRVVYREYYDGVANGVMSDYKFDYNEAGNLVAPGATYDNQVSIYRTNKIWMFLSRNYSLNNLATASTYNSNGLPLTFSTTAARGASMHFLEFLDISNCEVIYDCGK